MKQSNIKLVIFDLDGTLVDAYAAVHKSMNFAAKRIGIKPFTFILIKRSVGRGEKNLVQRLIPEEHVESFLAHYRKHHPEALRKNVKLLKGSRAILKSLKQKKIKLAIASNRPTRFVKLILRYADIDAFFDYILCADRIKRPKPYGDILKKILKKFSLKPSQAVYIGDMALDVETGKNANVKTIAVVTGSCSRREICVSRPFKTAKDLIEVNTIVNQL